MKLQNCAPDSSLARSAKDYTQETTLACLRASQSTQFFWVNLYHATAGVFKRKFNLI